LLFIDLLGNIKYDVQSLDEAKEIMGNEPKAVFLGPSEGELGLEGYPCLIKRAKKSYLKSTVSFTFQKNSPYTKLFSYFLLKMMESGQIQEIYRKHISALKDLKHINDVCNRKFTECVPGEPECVASIGIETVCTAVAVVIVGIALGIGIETVQFLLNNKYNTKDKGKTIKPKSRCTKMSNSFIITTCTAFIICCSSFLIILFGYVMFNVSNEHGNMDLM